MVWMWRVLIVVFLFDEIWVLCFLFLCIFNFEKFEKDGGVGDCINFVLLISVEKFWVEVMLCIIVVVMYN